MLTGPNVILVLKIAVLTVTVIFLTSIAALLRGNQRLHGRINTVFFVLTLIAVVGLEVVVRLIDRDGEMFQYLFTDPVLKRAMSIHLCFSVPSAVLMPVMLYTGWTHRRRMHLSLAVLFGALWTGTFITGIFFLPHTP